MQKEIEIFTFTDQPTTCPNCGNRTEILHEEERSISFAQTHQCLTIDCKFIFQVEEY